MKAAESRRRPKDPSPWGGFSIERKSGERLAVNEIAPFTGGG